MTDPSLRTSQDDDASAGPDAPEASPTTAAAAADASTYGQPPDAGQPDDRNEFQRAANGDQAPDVNNPAADPANESGGSRPYPDVLDQLYETMGAVQAGGQLRDQEGEELKKRLAEQEQVLIDTRKAALEADDEEAFKAATSELEQLMQAWAVLDQSDDDDSDEEPDAPQPEPEAGDGDADERGGDGDDRGGRDREPLAGGGGHSELRGGPDGRPPDDRD